MLDKAEASGKENAGKGAKTSRLKKSPLTAKKLQTYRQNLIQRRSDVLEDVLSLEMGALRGSGDDATHKAFHPQEQGAEAFDQDFSLQLAASERQMLEEIDAAIRRIDQGTFGICEKTGAPIQEARLKAKPWARMCITAAQNRDQTSVFPSSSSNA